MPFCTACGQQNPDDARFCSQCGTRLRARRGRAAPADRPGCRVDRSRRPRRSRSAVPAARRPTSLGPGAQPGRRRRGRRAARRARAAGRPARARARAAASCSTPTWSAPAGTPTATSSSTTSRSRAGTRSSTAPATPSRCATSAASTAPTSTATGSTRCALNDGDEVQIGKYRLVFFAGARGRLTDADAATASHGRPARAGMSIGEVLELLREDFPA